eukprot:432192-Pleurochrysis_carterae.AAC.1
MSLSPSLAPPMRGPVRRRLASQAATRATCDRRLAALRTVRRDAATNPPRHTRHGHGAHVAHTIKPLSHPHRQHAH